MREFAIYDNNGYILQFGQNLSPKLILEVKGKQFAAKP